MATGLLYGETDARREAALAVPDARELPWVAASPARVGAALGELTG